MLRARMLCCALAALVAAGCLGAKVPPTATPEARLAIQGRAIIVAATGVLDATEAALAAGAINREQARTVALALASVGEAGERLADALRIVDATQGADRQIAAGQARTILQAMTASLESIPPGVRVPLGGQLQRVFDLIRDVAFVLPPVLPALP